MGAEVVVETSPNENALKYTVVGKQVIDKGHKTYGNAGEAAECEVAKNLFGLEGVVSVFLMADFVTVSHDRVREIVRDLRSAELSALLDALNELGAERGVRFQEMEGRAVVTGFADLLRLRAMPPDEALDQRSSRCAPRGAGARTLRQFASRAAAVLMSHDINAVRRDLGENPADQLWLWGSGPAPRMPALGERWDVGAVGIAVDPMALGAFRLAGIDVVEPNDNQPTSLAHAAIDALHSCHLVIVYADAAQLASLAGDVFGKVAAIEAIDAELIAPVRRRLAEESQWRMLIAPTIAAEVELRCYSSESTIVCLAGHDIESSREAAFDEDHAEVGEMDIERGWELMEHFLLR